MKKGFKFSILALFCLFACAVGSAFEPMDGNEVWILKSRVVPTPGKMELGAEIVTLDNTLTVTLAVARDAEKARTTFETFFPLWFAEQKPVVKSEAASEEMAPEEYKIFAEGQNLRISADSDVGVLHALKTLRQLAEANRGTEKISAYFVPELRIEDAPRTAFRGMHLCWFPETEPARIEQAVRMAAYYKYNFLVLEFWGVYPFEKHPEFCWSEKATTRAEVERLVALGKSLGIQMIPQINIYGHASWARSVSGKHTTLDFHPEFQPLFEPDGWTWCLSNPKTRQVLTDMVLELHEVFGNPPYFHIGCDEAGSGTCRDCRRADYGQLLVSHLSYFTEILKERGCRPMLWHDMLVPGSQFPGYVANAGARTKDLLSRLPKDILICDWQYGAPKENESWPSMKFFQEQGFDTIACPWNNRAGIVSQAKTVQEREMYGILVTTWHHFSTSGRMYTMLCVGSQAAWTGGQPSVSMENFAVHLRQVGWDMHETHYRNTGYVDFQLPPETSGPY